MNVEKREPLVLYAQRFCVRACNCGRTFVQSILMKANILDVSCIFSVSRAFLTVVGSPSFVLDACIFTLSACQSDSDVITCMHREIPFTASNLKLISCLYVPCRTEFV